ncbi:hypothetical protein, partial [Natrinema sp. H-ect4]|uniref:hypothetical protein n=1 Tax=Natrinema sp. H-ect4 TaxID=3242699 RepID=UPI0035A8954E
PRLDLGASSLLSRFSRRYLNVFERSSRAITWTGGNPSPSVTIVSGVGLRNQCSSFVSYNCRTRVSVSLA